MNTYEECLAQVLTIVNPNCIYIYTHTYIYIYIHIYISCYKWECAYTDMLFTFNNNLQFFLHVTSYKSTSF